MVDEDLRRAAELWAERYNAGDMAQFVRLSYTEHPLALACAGATLEQSAVSGVEALIAFEERGLRALPTRRMHVQHIHVAGATVVVEAELRATERPGWACPFVSVQEYHQGRIAVDRNYGDFTQWPGVRAPS